jgi:hypothetical protein
LLRELASIKPFKDLVKVQAVHQNDGTREEIVLKFFAYLDWGDQYDGNVKAFLNRYMKEMGPKIDIEAARKLFREVASSLFGITNGPMLRKGYANTPLNQLEAVLVAAGKMIRSDKADRQASRELDERRGAC